MKPCRVLGLLSGTSMDGIDVAAGDVVLRGSTLELTPIGTAELAYPDQLRAALLDALPPRGCSAQQLCRLDTEVGQAFADAARHAITTLAGGRADVIASLGQTIFHWVEGSTCRGTLQLGQPAWIAERTGLPVVADLRVRDVAAGGHGAPLAGLFDAWWLGGGADVRIALNLGGIANITVVGPSAPPVAYDTGPGNALLDAACQLGGRRQDSDGELALAGTVREDLLDVLLADGYFAALPPKSTGKEHFNDTCLATALGQVRPIGEADLLATLVELTARTVADACHWHGAAQVVASGGGVRNPALMAALARRLAPTELITSDELGVPAAGKEAYLTVVLGALSWFGLPGNLPGTTGAAGQRVLGNITPGAGPLRLPEPATDFVDRLTIVAPPSTPVDRATPPDLAAPPPPATATYPTATYPTATFSTATYPTAAAHRPTPCPTDRAAGGARADS